ncbi:MAG: NAD(P)-binding domain-containing protein, partial [Thermomicrobiaceae bacterium]|nr:NAD(P)-binding domain-containing protein [Thermomicrobiaceae bacterium]
SWRRRFDSLALFTPRAYSALPGLPVPGDPNGYPTKDEIADYLEAYAQHFGLPVTLGTGVARLERVNDAFRATTAAGDVISARAVVLATGAFQRPHVPAIAARLAAGVVQMTPESYRNPAQTPGGTVLVVGDGATGRQIARELAGTRRVLLATGRPRRVSPNRILGKSVFWWMDRLGIIRAPSNSRIGRRLLAADPFPGKHLELDRLREGGVEVVGRLAEADGRRVTFVDGSTAEVDAVVWATGYHDETGWVAIPEATDARGAFVEQAGRSPVPGLYFIGRSWQRSRGSALLTGVGADAADVVGDLVRTLQAPVPAPAPPRSQRPPRQARRVSRAGHRSGPRAAPTGPPPRARLPDREYGAAPVQTAG